jgi:hypothetical protein
VKILTDGVGVGPAQVTRLCLVGRSGFNGEETGTTSILMLQATFVWLLVTRALIIIIKLL